MDKRFIGARLREARERLGITRADAARAIGVSIPAYGHKETGVSETAATEIAALAALFRVPVGFLYGEEGDEEMRARDAYRVFVGLSPEMQRIMLAHMESLSGAAREP